MGDFSWLNLVCQVKTRIINSKEYIYIPDLTQGGFSLFIKQEDQGSLGKF